MTLVTLVSTMGLARAEVISQSFTLKPGWNAIFLELEPQSVAPADVFSGITNLQSVWMWNPQAGTVEFIQDPNTLLPDQPQWLVYIPGNPIATNLHAIHANTAYLVNLGGSSDVVFSVTGEPRIPVANWKANSFNFVGFHLIGDEESFGSFFSSSPALDGQDIYVLDNGTGSWSKVTDPANTNMKRGEGFWIYCKGSSVFTGPLSVKTEQSGGLRYGKKLSEQNLVVYNHSAYNMAVTLAFSALTDHIYYWTFDQAQGQSIWKPFPTSLELSIPAGQSQKIRIGVKRAGLTADVDYFANLSVTETQSSKMELLVPVSVTGISYAGLWVGNATINKVNEPANANDPNSPVKTGSEFSFRIIIHVDDSNHAKLLSEVIQMWQEGTWKPDPNDLGKLIVDQPGHFVLIANEGEIPNYSGAALRDGKLVGRRISAPAFPRITDPTERDLGSFNPSSGGILSTEIILEADDPTNPFRHLYHPDHRGSTQSYEITRTITMEFSDTDYDENPIPGIFEMTEGSYQIGGKYKETITGLHRAPLYIEGTFLLHKVSNIGTLIE